MSLETTLILGEPRRPWYKKINPIWWLGNDEASAQNNTFYYAYVRNIAQNFRWYVIGLVDRPHWVTGRSPLCNKRSDIRPIPESGFQYSVIWLCGLPILPWISYSSKHFTFYFGWEPRGGFGILLNLSNSDLN